MDSMTADDFLQDSLKISHFYIDECKEMGCFSRDVQKAMVEFAELKCKELLEIVAEKATVFEYWNDWYVDKDSILKAVDLKEFIK